MTAKADRIQSLLDDEHLQEAFENVKAAIHQKIDECPIRDSEGLISLRLSLHLLESVKANLVKAIQEGNLEDFRAQDKVTFLGDLKWPKNKQ